MVNIGVCDQSFGIHVAKMAKFPDSVVQVINRYAVLMKTGENSWPSEKLENWKVLTIRKIGWIKLLLVMAKNY